jgi:predicted ATPase
MAKWGMGMSSLEIRGYRSISDSGVIPLSPITVFVGKNNSGKSSILRAAYMMQNGGSPQPEDYRLDSSDDLIVVRAVFEPGNAPTYLIPHLLEQDDSVSVQLIAPKSQALQMHATNMRGLSDKKVEQFPNIRPNHLFVPIFTQRRTENYIEEVKGQYADTITVTDNNLMVRIDAIQDPTLPSGQTYRRLMEEIFDLVVGTYQVDNGKAAGLLVGPRQGISLRRMGDGISSVVGLISELARDENHIFLWEEPENDLHPAALRATLDVLIEYSDRNQFLVSTHSDIVLRHLGALSNTLVHSVTSLSESRIPTLTVEANLDLIRRREVLSDMGFILGNPIAWLILEESSAQSVLQQILIPFFAPALTNITIVSSNGADKVKATLDELARTVLFLHLSDPEKNAWVMIDGDEKGLSNLEKLKTGYSGWPEGRFQCFPEPIFERFYPTDRFHDKIVEIELSTSKEVKKLLKRDLLIEVLKWAEEHPEVARDEFAISAAPVIAMLQEMEKSLR